MDFWQETNWYAVQTKPHHENIAAARVAECDLETFLPKVRQEQTVCGTERWVTKALFPGYLFARFSPSLSYDLVRYAAGVLRVVGSRQQPIPLDGQIIDSIRDRIGADGFVRLDCRTYQPNDKVTVEHGPFAGWMGRVEREWDDGKRVAILLEAIQQAQLLIDKRWLAPVSH